MEKIHFSKFEDTGLNIVWTGLVMKKNDIDDIDKWFTEIGLLQKGKVLDALNIDGNVLGDKGRNDVLLILEKGTEIDPIKRLLVNGLTWTGDFISNYGKDYGVVEEEADEEDD